MSWKWEPPSIFLSHQYLRLQREPAREAVLVDDRGGAGVRMRGRGCEPEPAEALQHGPLHQAGPEGDGLPQEGGDSAQGGEEGRQTAPVVEKTSQIQRRF